MHSGSQHIWEWGSLVLELINLISYTCLFTSFFTLLYTGFSIPCSLLSAIVVETTDSLIISCDPGFSSSLLPGMWGCMNTFRVNNITQMVWFKKEKSFCNFSKLYQSLMVWLLHRKLLETQEEKQKACDRRSVNTLNWCCCKVVGWFVCESLHFAPRLLPSSSDRNNCTSSSEEEVNQQWEETGLEWRGGWLVLGWLCWCCNIT